MSAINASAPGLFIGGGGATGGGGSLDDATRKDLEDYTAQ